MPRGNPSPKLAITIDPDIHESILLAVAEEGVSVSAWMTVAAREALQRRAGLAAVNLWEKQHGRFTAEEMDEARRRVRAQFPNGTSGTTAIRTELSYVDGSPAVDYRLLKRSAAAASESSGY